jgi:hypothetical protein
MKCAEKAITEFELSVSILLICGDHSLIEFIELKSVAGRGQIIQRRGANDEIHGGGGDG